MSGPWTHSLCTDCWNKRNPERQAVKMIRGPEEKCCDCGENHQSGIYYRAAPSVMNCGGEHREEACEESSR